MFFATWANIGGDFRILWSNAFITFSFPKSYVMTMTRGGKRELNSKQDETHKLKYCETIRRQKE